MLTNIIKVLVILILFVILLFLIVYFIIYVVASLGMLNVATEYVDMMQIFMNKLP